jgi:4-hydroxy-3-methylbut-2-enyl diphosphate reductase
MEILLANPRGFCAGVDRAIDIVERAVKLFGPPIHVRHEVVHNRFVVDRLRKLGAIFVDELEEVPDDATVIFSAHGVSMAVQQEAARRGLNVFDATCPLVTKVHMEVTRYARDGREVVLIGHAGHPEVEGTMGQYDHAGGGDIYLVETPGDVASLPVRDPGNVAFVTQTTLSVDDTARVIDALRARFPNLTGPRKEDICYATQNRQDAVKDLVRRCEIVLVVGSPALRHLKSWFRGLSADFRSGEVTSLRKPQVSPRTSYSVCRRSCEPSEATTLSSVLVPTDRRRRWRGSPFSGLIDPELKTIVVHTLR